MAFGRGARRAPMYAQAHAVRPYRISHSCLSSVPLRSLLLRQRADVGDELLDLALLQPHLETGHRPFAVADLAGELLVRLLLHLGRAQVLRLCRLACRRVRAAVPAVA